jgi:hypothetical protein
VTGFYSSLDSDIWTCTKLVNYEKSYSLDLKWKQLNFFTVYTVLIGSDFYEDNISIENKIYWFLKLKKQSKWNVCVNWQLSKISEDIVHRQTVCFCPVTTTAGVTMVMEILVNISRFAGKLKYFYISPWRCLYLEREILITFFLFLVKLYQFLCIIQLEDFNLI